MLDISEKSLAKYAVSFLVAVLIISFSPDTDQAFSPQVIQRGATGDDVIELQARLQFIGYYKGNIDGVFGWETYWAVRNFQHDFGLDVDGYVGDQVKQKLEEVTWFDRDYVYGKLERGKEPRHFGRTGRGPDAGWPPPGQRLPGNEAQRDYQPHAAERPQQQAPGARQAPGGQQAPTAPEAPQAPAQPPAGQDQADVGQAQPAVNLPQGFTENDLRLMANAVYGEARGEPYEGQVAVAAVILNRVRDSRFPNTVSGVIFEPLAFTAVADGQIWLEPNETARRAVQDAINGWDPTNGLVYYFNPDTATSAWMHARTPVKRIGKHVFVR
jgi:N-acetylmuramoyl-L-alanine amidase